MELKVSEKQVRGEMFDTHEKFELDLNIDGNDDQEEVVSILKQKTKYSIGDHTKTNFT